MISHTRPEQPGNRTRSAWPWVLTFTTIATGALLACKDDPPRIDPAGGPAASASAKPSTSAVASASAPALPVAPPVASAPAWLPETPAPADNATTAQKVLLGKMLFVDKRLSKDGSANCMTCHLPDKGWTDAKVLSQKVGGAMNIRHTPTLFNVAYNTLWYWDGRAPTLEKQIEAAWKGQMGADPVLVADKIAKIPGYQVQFKSVFGHDATPDDIVKALAAFVRTLRSGDSPWDKYEKGDKTAVSEAAVRGFAIFREKAQCAQCHAPPLYTDNGFHNVGIGYDKKDKLPDGGVAEVDKGRGKIANDPKLDGAFKTPTLRSISTSGPYFHDGRAATLEEAVDLMLSGGIKNPNLDAKLKKITLKPEEKKDLIAFLEALKGAEPPFDPPALP